MSPLPVRSEPLPGQSLLDWLEHLADLNGMTTAQMSAEVRAGGGTTRFLPVRPDPRTATTISELTSQSPQAVRATTLARYDGTALDLAGLHSDRWSSWRTVAARGWFRPNCTAACPACLAQSGYWHSRWRLPTVTICDTHHCYLLETCPSCGRHFDDHPHTPLRLHAGSCCLNPVGHRTWCELDIATLSARQASRDDIQRQARHDRALGGDPVCVAGTLAPATTWIADCRSLAVLLLHIATQTSTDGLAAWVDDVRHESETASRSRWHLAPPADPQVRSAVLTTADQVLAAPDVTSAAELLAPWVDAAPTGTESRLVWLADRTAMTPTLERLILASLAPRQRVSTHLSRADHLLAFERIPQAVPETLYSAHAGTLFSTSKGDTNRLFLSLCLARQAGARTWADAATSLGLDADLGSRAARAVSTRSRLDPGALTVALGRVARGLAANYRTRERTVRNLSIERTWFDDWVDHHRPGTSCSSHPLAVTWLWCHFASGLLSATPAYAHCPSRSARTRYWRFTASLTPPAAAALSDIAHRFNKEKRHDDRS